MSTSSNLISIYDSLYGYFENAISSAYPDLVDPPVVISSSNNVKFGDYQCNSALPLCKLLSASATQGDKSKHHMFYLDS